MAVDLLTAYSFHLPKIFAEAYPKPYLQIPKIGCGLAQINADK
jgi:hypothetical protein